MDRRLLPNAIAGGYVRSYEISLLDKRVGLHVDVLENGVLSTFYLTFDGVTNLEFSDQRANRWERIEISDLVVEHGPEADVGEDWLIRFNLWDVAELVLRCATVRVDGELLC